MSNNIELLDTPGVLWPKLEDENTALNLSHIGTIKDELLERTEIAYNLLKYLLENYNQNLFERYKLTEEEMNNEAEDLTYSVMQLIAKKRGAIVSGGNIDDEKVSNIILNDFREGKLRQNNIRKAINIWPVGQEVKTPPSQGGIMGSIPVRVTKQIVKLLYIKRFTI